MTDEDRAKVKAVWAGISEKEKEAANAELKEILKWWSDEEEKAVEKLKKEGRYKGGLDGHYPELIEVSKKAHKKIEELGIRVFGISGID